MRRIIISLGVIILLLAPITPAAAANGTLVGHVSDADVGGPVAGVEIWAGPGLPTVTTDSSGNYSMSLAPNGGYHVLANGAGYAMAHEYGADIFSGAATRLDFALTKRQGTITGRVQDSFGQPLVADVIADSIEGTGFGSTRSDATGSFTINRLAPMSYYAHAFPSDPSYAPMALSGVLVQDGQTTNVTLVVTAGTGRVAVTIRFPDGSPVANANLYIDTSENSSSSSGQTDSAGRYVSRLLPPARYNIHVSDVPGWANEVRWGVPVNAGATTDANFTLSNVVGAIAGFIRDVSGEPIPGARIDALATQSKGPWGYQSVTSGADGWYKLDMLLPGSYSVFVNAPGVPGLRAEGVPVSAGVSTQPVNFVYTFPGRAVAANPNGGYYVLSGTGAVYARDNAPYYGAPSFGSDIARGIAVMPDGLGYIVLDGLGGIHKYGSAAQGSMSNLVAPYFGWDIARGVGITPTGKGLAVLDGWGGYHARGDAPSIRPPYWPGWDIARSVTFSPSGSGVYILDGFGGVHTSGDAVPRLNPYFGWDIARGLYVTPSNGGYTILDGFGGIHVLGDAPVPGPGSFLGTDRWRGLTVQGGKYLLVRNDGLATSF